MPPQWYEGWMENTIAAMPGEGNEAAEKYIRKLFEYLNHDPGCEQMLQQMEEAGIDKTTLLIIDWGLTYDDYGYDLEEVLQYHHRKLQEHPDKFWVYAGIDPRRGQAGLDLFEQCVSEWGFKGLKIYPPCGYSPSDERLFPYYEICEQHQLPVLTHVGPSAPSLRANFATPMEIETAAWKFPKVNFILGHGAFTYHYECSLLATHRNNIYLDMSGFQTHSDEKLKEMMQHHFSLNLHKKILFGTDWPIHFFSGNQRTALAKVKKLLSSDICDRATHDLVMYKNYERLMS